MNEALEVLGRCIILTGVLKHHDIKLEGVNEPANVNCFVVSERVDVESTS